MKGDPDLIDTIAPFYRFLRQYARLVVSGTENVPKGKALIAANHTGWNGLDYALLFLVLHDDLARFPEVAVHPAYGRLPSVARLQSRLGMFDVSVTTATKALDRGSVVVIFPEAERGNFKPFWKRAELAPFQPGVGRIALAANAPIVPAVIVGGDEATPSVGIVPTREKIGFDLPIPLSLLPLPAKWRLRFLPPIDPGEWLGGDSQDKDAAGALTRHLRNVLQEALVAERRARGHPFVGP